MNLAFHLEVLSQVISQLVSSGDARGDIMAKHKKFAALGALGPDVLRYVPISVALSDSLDNLMAQPLVPGNPLPLTAPEIFAVSRNPLGAAYSVIFRQLVVPAWPVVNRIKSFLDDMDAIAQAENLLALQTAVGQASGIQSEASSLQGYVTTAEKVAVIVGGIVFLSAPWMEQEFVTIPGVAADDPTYNRPFEFLRWHRTGDFALTLLNQATTNPDPKVGARQRAFAYGYLSHMAASLTGEPFVNNITGGPYRTHWWRNRLVSNFIDSWTYGYFNSNAQMKGDEPTPPYASWKPLCSANIQAEFDVAGLAPPKSHDVPDAVKAVASGDLGNLPDQFPDDLAELLLNTVTATYLSGQQPLDGFTKETFKRAFVGAFAVYWFMTSGSGPMCDNPLGPPPANCESAPDWITSGAIPTPQQAGLNTGGATCAALLATAALLLILSGALVAGVAALIAAINAPIVDWDKVRCNLFWLRKTLVDIENALRDSLVRGGLAYPPPQKLGTIDTNGNTRPAADDTPGSGVPFCRSNNQAGTLYPRIKDKTNPSIKFADFNFSSFPVNPGAEIPVTRNLIQSGLYPDFVVNATGLGLNNSILTDGPPLVSQTSQISQKVLDKHVFGDAVSNARDLIVKDGVGLQN
ncbi:MAG TPA: hypothetical protein VM870_00565, partial [Pyrinomonadaceae bacterium]|nr:hypothetical protein [Pyrinomonadaceae bacterium]